VIALARSRGNIMQAVEIGKEWHDSTPEVELALKAAVAVGSTTSAGWAGALVAVQQMADEFITLLRPQTIIGRIPGFRQVPFNVKMPRQLTGSTASWVGQGLPKPVSALSFDTVTLGFAKCAGIVVLTEELVRLSSPAAEGVVRQDLLDTISQFQDEQFINPAVAAVANVSPASVTNGVAARTSTGASLAQVSADVEAVINSFITARISLASGVWVMHPRTALHLALLRNTGGGNDTFAFPTISMQGGTWFGMPVVVSANVPVSVPTGDTTIIALLSAGDIFLADEGGVNIDSSREASVQLQDNPGTGASALVSFWQNNLVGLRAERMVNWLKRRSAAVQVIDSVQY
jgi:HK97 family phage major capsid protein